MTCWFYQGMVHGAIPLALITTFNVSKANQVTDMSHKMQPGIFQLQSLFKTYF
jgi:hypothetical protein